MVTLMCVPFAGYRNKMRVDVGERFSAFHVLTLRCDRLALAGDSGDRQSEGGIWRMVQTKFDLIQFFW